SFITGSSSALIYLRSCGHHCARRSGRLMKSLARRTASRTSSRQVRVSRPPIVVGIRSPPRQPLQLTETDRRKRVPRTTALLVNQSVGYPIVANPFHTLRDGAGNLIELPLPERLLQQFALF